MNFSDMMKNIPPELEADAASEAEAMRDPSNFDLMRSRALACARNIVGDEEAAAFTDQQLDAAALIVAALNAVMLGLDAYVERTPECRQVDVQTGLMFAVASFLATNSDDLEDFDSAADVLTDTLNAARHGLNAFESVTKNLPPPDGISPDIMVGLKTMSVQRAMNQFLFGTLAKIEGWNLIDRGDGRMSVSRNMPAPSARRKGMH